jgi:hypothetical protein
VFSPEAVVAEARPPTPSKLRAVAAVFSVDAEAATSLVAAKACQAAALARVVPVPAAPEPTSLR